jgi:hypothetical protein
MSDFWFARRFPLGHPRTAMAPVSREGWIVVVAFIVAMALGGIIFILLALAGAFVLGLVVFVLLAAAGGGLFILLASAKGDASRTVHDYRSPTG